MDENWQNKHLIFFDGDCGICNFWVQWILERDKKDQFMFASLQSDFGQKFLAERGLNTKVFNTLYLWKPGQYYLEKSKAVLKIANLIGGIYRFSVLGKIIPFYLSDKLYDIVSKNRMKIANQKCYLPTPHQRAKFIDV
ncbi:thiol-disulfide oxidoreductase DCC family protein [Chryseobacterium sp. CCH4-E10]|uniref:thiol-disulfide oxidoreductase DCC family protein n=1 Tax=Chryseobacterium sp. CCH4-E10 TaxID=1768758 RepID=UPI0008312A70|nr:DCC1-like thiol-disulfide oxidoreductase family protein [Chryseobacterium sp. CCH4-E10]